MLVLGSVTNQLEFTSFLIGADMIMLQFLDSELINYLFS